MQKQGKGVITDIRDKIQGFQTKLDLWRVQKRIYANFPTFGDCKINRSRNEIFHLEVDCCENLAV